MEWTEPEGREGGDPPSEFRKEQSLEKSEKRFTVTFVGFDRFRARATAQYDMSWTISDSVTGWLSIQYQYSKQKSL